MRMAGASIGFFQGDARKLVSEDLPALQPTLMAGTAPTRPSIMTATRPAP